MLYSIQLKFLKGNTIKLRQIEFVVTLKSTQNGQPSRVSRAWSAVPDLCTVHSG